MIHFPSTPSSFVSPKKPGLQKVAQYKIWYFICFAKHFTTKYGIHHLVFLFCWDRFFYTLVCLFSLPFFVFHDINEWKRVVQFYVTLFISDQILIYNPIELGTSLCDKTFILDIRLSLNDDTIINLELQVINQHNWVERSLSYLCRSFDTLQSGQNYKRVPTVIQIGLLNFTLFPERPEFYATYQLLNVRNHSLYSDKLRLSVLDLTQIPLATEKDRSCQLDCWARFFKSTTWEELNMLAQNNETLKDAASTVYQLTAEERIRMECEAREDYYRTQKDIQNMIDETNAKYEAATAEKEALTAELAKLRAWVKEQGYDPENI